VKVDGSGAKGILEGVRGVTDKPLYVDANEGWTDPKRAVEAIRWMEGMGVVLVEQPLPASDLDGAKYGPRPGRHADHRDEAVLTAGDIDRLAQAYDGINVKVQKAGGLRMARTMIARARSLA